MIIPGKGLELQVNSAHKIETTILNVPACVNVESFFSMAPAQPIQPILIYFFLVVIPD